MRTGIGNEEWANDAVGICVSNHEEDNWMGGKDRGMMV